MISRPAYRWPAWRALALAAGIAGGAPILAEEAPVTISAEQLKALQDKASEVERLKAQLDAAQRELNALKSNPVARPAVPPPAGAKAPLWVPPAALRAQTNEAPARPLADLPAVSEATEISVRDLVGYFSQDARESAARFQGRTLTIRGVVTDLRKPLFQSPYEVSFRQLDSPLRVACVFRPPAEFTRVYATDNGEQVVGEGNGIRTVFARVGAELSIRGYCEGLKDGVIRLSGCSYLVSPPIPAR